MSKIKFSELTEGSVILRPKNGAQFKVISILADEKKADLKSVEGEDRKSVV